MSTGIADQHRMKGQGNQANGQKELRDQEEHEVGPWRSGQLHQGYSAQINTTLPSDPYMPNYYSTTFTPGYPPYGVGEGTWSNGGDPMGFLGVGVGVGGYTHTHTASEMAPHPGSYIDGMFGGSGANYSQANASYTSFPAPTAAPFNYYGNGDYSTWGSTASMARKAHYEDYYREGMYSTPDAALKALEHGVQSMTLDHKLDYKLDKDPREPKKLTWASVASQPAKPQPMMLSSGMKKKGPGMPPPPMIPGKHLDIGTWETRNGGYSKPPVAPPPTPQVIRPAWTAPPPLRHPPPPQHQQLPPPLQPQLQAPPPQVQPQPAPPPPQPVAILAPPPAPLAADNPVLDQLKVKNNYNPPDFDMSCKGARFFVIKSYSEDDIHRSIKYEIWCSTEHGNKRLDQAFRETENGPIYLFFSVNGSGHFCGMAQMLTPVDYHASSSVWAQDKWKGQFKVRWIYVKDVPNGQLRHIQLENNENKSVTNSRDTQEVPFEKGRQVLRVLHGYRHTTSIFDDFFHYEKRQEEETHKRVPDEREPPPYQKQERKEVQRENREPQREQRERERGDRDRERERDREPQPQREPRDREQGRPGPGPGQGRGRGPRTFQPRS